MKKIITLFGLVMTSVALAQDGIYFTAEGGAAWQNGLPSAEQANALSVSTKNPSALRGAVGYNHDFNQYWGLGLDIGVAHYGKTTYDFGTSTTTVATNTMEFAGAASLHIKKVDIIGKLGGARITPQFSNTDSSDTEIHPFASITGAYNFTRRFAGTISYMHIFGSQAETMNDIATDASKLDAVLVGIRYTFAPPAAN